jgi:hypothetical protein
VTAVRNPNRHAAPPAPALTRALGTPMTRQVLCARITTLRAAIGDLYAQAEVDGHGALPGTGALKVALITYENELRTLGPAGRTRRADAAGSRARCGHAVGPAGGLKAMSVAVVSLICGAIYLTFTMLIVGDL